MPGVSPIEPDFDFDGPSPEFRFQRRLGGALSLLALAALLAFQFILLKRWIGGESRPPAWDQAIHLEIALDYKELIARGDWSGAFHLKPKPGMPPFPPLYHLSLLPACGRPDPVRAALWIQFGYLCLLTISLYGLGRHYGGDWRGVAAAALFTCTPVVERLTRTQLPDLALAAWVCAAYLAFARSDGFRKRGASLLFAAAFAAGMLTKWSAWTYFLPLLAVLGPCWRDRIRRRRLIASAALSAAVFLPWYLACLPVLAPRLFEAAGDQAVPVWSGWAALSYLRSLASDFDAPFWALSIAALLAPSLRRSKEDGWVLPAWVVTSYIFWTIVPNRQVRFLLPGLPALGVLVAAGPFPPVLSAGAVAFQLLTAANFTWARLAPVRLDLGVPLSLLSSWPPAKEDWKIEDILLDAAGRHDARQPFGNVTLVANDTYFNGPGFNWELKRLGVKTLRMRGVNRRVCEFSEFVVVKTGSLGPSTVIGQLPEARKLMLDVGGWFQKGYEEVRRWPLPDGSAAVLFQRRRLSLAPLKERGLRYDYFETGAFRARDLIVDLGPWDSGRGVYPRAKISAKELELRGLKLSDVAARFDDLFLVPVRDARKTIEDARFLSLGRLTVDSAAVKAGDAEEFLKGRISVLKDPSVVFDKAAVVAASWRGVPLGVVAEPALLRAPAGLRVRLKSATAGGLTFAVPEGWGTFDVPFEPNPETPFDIRVAGLSLKDGRLAVP